MKLQIDPGVLVLTEKDALHAATRRGFFTVRGKDLHRLHERLKPHLQGRYEEEELLSAVSSEQQPAVRTYLDKLREAGVLKEDRAPREVRLTVLTPAQAGPPLLALRGPEQKIGAQVWLIADEPVTAEDREEQALCARWLLRNRFDLEDGQERLQIYRLEGAAGDLTRVALLEKTGPYQSDTLPLQLGIVQPAEVDQVPLSVARAVHPFFQPNLLAYGLTLEKVREHLLRCFMAAADLALGGQLRFWAGPLDAPFREWVRTALPDASLPLACASSLLELRIELLERAIERRVLGTGESAWAQEDLLSTRDEGHPTVAFLQSVLRLRRENFPVRVTRSPEGLFLLDAGSCRTRSFLWTRAVAELLLREIGQSFLGLLEGEPVCSLADFATPHMLRRLVREQAGSWGSTVHVAVRHLRSWGRSVWMGALMGRETP